MSPVAAVASTAAGLICGPMVAIATVVVPSKSPLALWRKHVGTVSRRRHLAVTILSVLAFGLTGLAVGTSWALPGYLWLAAAGVTLGVIDADCHRLPNRVMYPTYFIGIGWLGLAAVLDRNPAEYVRALCAMAVLFAIFCLVALISPASIGFGDVKLAGLLGLYVGWFSWSGVVWAVMLAFMVGGLFALPLLLTRRMGLRSTFPFGPALLLGALLAILAGPASADSLAAM